MSDEIFLTDLRIETIIGIYDWERKQKQTVGIDLRMPGDVRKAAASDHIDDTVNYKAIAKRVISHTEESSYQLIETLAESIATIALNEFGLDWVEVHVHKPGAVRGSKDVGVRIRRGMRCTHGTVLVFVSLGSNIDPEANLTRALEMLEARFGPLRRSTVYRNRAVGFEGDDFLNLVAGFATNDTIEQVCNALAEIENKLGRVRGEEKFSSRSLDLDLLLYGDAVIRRDSVSVPRPEMHRYAFMLRPLAELAGDLRDPVSGRPYAIVWRDAGLADHTMTPATLET